MAFVIWALLIGSLPVVGVAPTESGGQGPSLSPPSPFQVGKLSVSEISTFSPLVSSRAGPTARCNLSETAVQEGESVKLDASASDNATAYRYDKLGNGEFGPWRESESRTFTYDEAGTYEPRVQVRSPADFTDAASCGTLTVEANTPPTADFSYSPAEPVPGETVSFVSEATDEDGDVVQYLWTVDGEPVGETPELTYTFEEAGDYSVELTATDDDGATDTANKTVTVVEENQPPSVNFSYTPQEPESDEQVTFKVSASDADGEVVEFTWFVDGEPIVTTPDREFGYVFDEPGDYTVEVVTKDDDGATANASQTVSVQPAENVPPTANFTYSPPEPTPGETVTFEAQADDPDGDVVDYEWTIDGEVVGNGLSIGYGFQEPGDHLVELTVTDDDGASAIVERIVTVVEPENQPPVVSIAYSPTDPSTDEPVTFGADAADEDGEVVRYEWSVDGELIVSSSDSEFGYEFEEPGEYHVEVVVTDDDGAQASAERTVTVDEAKTQTETPGGTVTPTPTNTPTATPTEPGELTAEWWTIPLYPLTGETTTFVAAGPWDPSITYRWDVDNDGDFEKRGKTIEHSFGEPGRHTVNMGAVGPNGETKTNSSSVSVQEESIEASADLRTVWTIPQTPRPGEMVTLIAEPMGTSDADDTYRWDFDSDGDFEREGRVVNFAFSEGGNHSVTLEVVADGDLKTSVSTTVITTGEPIAENASANRGPLVWTIPQNPRPGEPTTLIADSVLSTGDVVAYRWDLDGDEEHDKRGEIITHTFPEAGQVSVNLSIERTNGSTVVVRKPVVIGDATPATERTVNDTTAIATETTDLQTRTGETIETTTASNPGLGFMAALVALALAIMIFARRAEI